MSRRLTVVVMFNLFVVACAPKTEGSNRDTMTQRQKDSVLGQSGIPGSQGVTKALRASDSAKARQGQVDSASQP